jgi:outer membrane protein TolC
MNMEISKNNMNDLKNNIRLEYGNYYRQYLSDMENLKTQKENTTLAKLNYDNLKYQYDNGVQPLIEVLNAETTLLQAQDNYINALYQALVDKVDLDRSLGKIKY